MNPLLILVACGLTMMAVELLHPDRAWPKVTGWWARAITLNGCQLVMVVLAGLAWDPWLRAHRPWSADRLNPYLAATIGYVVHTLVYYWWHRARHDIGFLWRWFHQVHHSPRRIEVLTSFYKHPLEILANSLLSASIIYGLVGLNAQVAAYVTLLNGLAEFFYHWNIKTPYWLGYLLQRPESHCVHHQQGLHAYNYGDLPVFDMLFGTFRNPRRWRGECGFDNDRERRLSAMLRGDDVNPTS